MPAGLYLHYPFCSAICSYCDYFKLQLTKELEKKYFSAIIKEAELRAQTLSSNSQIESIFVGGGTPSAASIEDLQTLINKIRSTYGIADDLEFSIECNPEDISPELVNRYQSLGVNRINVGMQTLDERQLKLLNRKHRVHDIHKSIYDLSVARFDNVAVDILFGFPKQTGKELAGDIAEIIALEPKHISLYQLTFEENTKLHTLLKERKIKTLDDDYLAAMMLSANEQLNEAGYVRYELNSFAKNGYECRHNLNYWRGGDFLGLGPSAVSKIGNKRICNPPDFDAYINSLSHGMLPADEHVLIPQEEIEDYVIMALRLTEGIDLEKFKERFEADLMQVLNSKELEILLKTNFLKIESKFLSMSDEGSFFYDEIIARLLADED